MPRFPHGFTLFELLLVLALLVVLGGIIAPALSGTFTNSKLSAAGDDIQSAWADARLLAIERGQSVAFRCLIGGREFSTTPYAMGQESIDRTAQEDGSTPALASGTLDEELLFAEAAAASALDASDPGQRSSMRDSSEWSAPIIFYPDGQSSDALLRIAHKEGRAITVTLRGLTGVSRKGEIAASGIPVEEGLR